MRHIKVKNAATGWIMSIEEREDRVFVGRSKSLFPSSSPKTCFESRWQRLETERLL